MTTDALGVVDLTFDDYLTHPALSSSGAKLLLPPSCPALFKWRQDHPEENKRTFDFGRAAHAVVLGTPIDVDVIDAKDWRTKAAQEAQRESYANGRTPLLAREWAMVERMADALARHPIAADLLSPDSGIPEASILWRDHEFDITRRARLDWLPGPSAGRMILFDYKTTLRGDLRSIEKHIGNYRYYMQAAWYEDAVRAVGLAEDVAFLFIFQEKTDPFLVTVVELDNPALEHGRRMNARAMGVYVECSLADQWPGYADDVELVSLPKWALNEGELR